MGKQKKIYDHMLILNLKIILFSQKQRVLLCQADQRNPKYARNKNILVIGGSVLENQIFCKPNIMQMHSSYVITDPKGTVLLEVGSMLAKGSPMTDENGKIVRDKEGKVI